MTGRKKRGSRASILTPRRDSIRLTQIPEKPTEEPAAPDAKDVIMTELLKSLLSKIAIKYEASKKFVKVVFSNLNSYSGWIGPHGFQGFGTYTYANGSSYRGIFDRSFTKGLGRYRYTDGSVYEGEFLGGRRHGYGKYITKRFQYDGYFKYGMFHGQGAWKSKAGEQNGLFQYGVLVQGEVTNSTGTFKGTFTEGASRKYGKFTFKNGNTYSGSWFEDLFCGFGIYDWNPEGRPITVPEVKYSGYWFNGERNGLGMLAVQKRYVISQWHFDRKFGAGIIVACNGNCYASPEMFEDDVYKGSHRVRMCKQSCEIFTRIVKLVTNPSPLGSIAEKSESLCSLIKELVSGYSDWFSEVYPMRIPMYEIGNISPARCCSKFEIRCLQQVLTENYVEFEKLYVEYVHPSDDYMNNLSLNLFYMDVFQQVKDVNVLECMKASQLTVCNQCLISDEKSANAPLMPVPFFVFFQHLLCVTDVLMGNDELKAAVEKYKPTFFGRMAMQVLFVLKILKDHEPPQLLVREAILLNRPAILRLMHEIEETALGDRTLRAAYMYLKKIGCVSGRSLNFIRAVEKYFVDVFQGGRISNIEFDISALELVEVVMRSVQMRLIYKEAKRVRQLMDLVKQCPEKKLYET